MRSGDYRVPVTFKSVDAGKDAFGQPLSTTTDVVRVGARVTSSPSSASSSEGVTLNEGTIEVAVRYNPTLASMKVNDIVTIGSDSFLIVSISKDRFLNKELLFSVRDSL